MKKVLVVAILALGLFSCNRPESNYEGVLMTNYGRDGIKSFETVIGAQGFLWFGSELYQVPMWEQTGDANRVDVITRDGSKFSVDPTYTYNATRLKGPNIVLKYKNYNVTEPDQFFASIEANILNKRVTDAYREEARKYATADSLMTNVTSYEDSVTARLKKEFSTKFFDLNTLTSGLVPPKSMIKAIEDRNNAIIKTNTVKNELETSKMYLEKARIDAETNRAKSGGLTKEVLQDKMIEAIRTSSNRIIITDGKTPIMLNN
jgi:regulator of protease activity HflC (stomatin/prohibitin superfamily)